MLDAGSTITTAVDPNAGQYVSDASAMTQGTVAAAQNKDLNAALNTVGQGAALQVGNATGNTDLQT